MSEPAPVSADVSTRALQVLLSVASTGSFRTTAERLYSSQPSISRAIARLERELGATLVVRGPRGARLTATGELVLDRARTITREIADLRNELSREIVSRIRLGAAPTAAAAFVAPFLAHWIGSNPEVDIEVIEGGSEVLRQRLAQDECDVAIVALPVSREFDCAPIRRLTVRAYYPPGHPVDTRDPAITVHELASYPLVVNSYGFLAGRIFRELCESAGVAPRLVYRSNHAQTLAAMAESGVAVAVFADSVDLRGFDLRSKAIIDADGDSLGFQLGVAWRPSPRIADFGYQLARFSQSGPPGATD